ncbi:MAG TPA: DUF1906 domain-containing protein [Candidatus Cryosericum sp.]|nr:DUF1906 domain-containing protein [Candidatus Cryosericum sp.]
MAQGIDYSFGRPDLHVVKAQGYTFVIRYLAQQGGGKVITPQEARQIRAHGLALALVYEQGAGRAREGGAAGRRDAETAVAQARTLGFPETRPVYFAVDEDVQEKDLPAVDAYLQGAGEVMGSSRVGVYGSYRVIEHCAATRSACFFWQTAAWSHGLVSSRAHLLQTRNEQLVGGARVDLDTSLMADFGAWAPPAAPVLSPAQQWAVEQGIFNQPVRWDAPIDYNTLAWALMKALAGPKK